MQSRALFTLLVVAACSDSQISPPSPFATDVPDGATTSGVTTDDGSSVDDPASDTSTAGPACDDDPACGPGEDVGTCPAQCNVCGDGVVFGAEACDNGENADPRYSSSPPAADACAPGCRRVEYCGDGVRSRPEPCDTGGRQTAACEVDCRLPVCGDGVHNVLAGEGCDDGDAEDGDGCAPICVVERRVFVSSASYRGDFDRDTDNPDLLIGVPLADARCNALAAAAGLSGRYKAWLSDEYRSPASRFDTSYVGLYRLASPGFPVVAHAWLDLADGMLVHAIDADEFGQPIADAGLAWTNTLASGQLASEHHCKNWTSDAADMENTTTVGAIAHEDFLWSGGPSGQSCGGKNHLYCFEDG